MDDILDIIKSRRTIKQFLPKFVSWDKLSKIIEAGKHAPSSGNIQNWKFIVVYEPEQRQRIAQACHEQYDFALASALIVVCGEPEKAERYYGEKGKLYTIQNCAAAIENMLLEANSLGLCSAWIGAFDEEEIKSICKVPENEAAIQAIVAIGYPKEIPAPPPKYPLETLVYFGRWRNKFKDPAKYMVDIASIVNRKIGAAKEALQEKSQEVIGKIKEKIQ